MNHPLRPERGNDSVRAFFPALVTLEEEDEFWFNRDVPYANFDSLAQLTDRHSGASNLTDLDGGETRGNEVGYAGYLWADERSQWHVRHRELSPRMGRWLQRDPKEFIDGYSLYQLCSSKTIIRTDPFGLEGGHYDRYGLPREFWEWYEHDIKEKGAPHIPYEEAEKYHKEWEKLGRPRPAYGAKYKKPWRQRGGFADPEVIKTLGAGDAAILFYYLNDIINNLEGFADALPCKNVVNEMKTGDCRGMANWVGDCCQAISRTAAAQINCESLLNSLVARCGEMSCPSNEQHGTRRPLRSKGESPIDYGFRPDGWGGEMLPPDGWHPRELGPWPALYGPDNTFPPTHGYPLLPTLPYAPRPMPILPPDIGHDW